MLYKKGYSFDEYGVSYYETFIIELGTYIHTLKTLNIN